MSRYIVGDIHGCFKSLTKLLAEVEFNPGTDDLWAVGDLIGRGPQSLKTLVYLHGLGDSFQATLGNHDLHFLAVANGIRPQKAQDRTAEIIEHESSRALINWLRNQPLTLFNTNEQLFVSHAGVPPQWTAQQAHEYAQSAEQVLSSASYVQLLASMYGNEPVYWCSSLPEPDRYRFIINALTRMRYCNADGALEFNHKEAPESEALDSLKPWYTFRPKEKNTLFFDHWAALSGKTERNDIIGLDTGCVWGNALTLYDCKRKERVSVPACD